MMKQSITGGKKFNRSRLLRINRSWIVRLIIIIIIGYSVYVAIRSVKSSILFLKKDRINVVFYGKQTVFVSLGLTDGVHYQIPYRNDLSIKVPGGYDTYKIGSLGKLSELEKNPKLIQKTFSYSTSSMVDFYFYPKSIEVYSDTTISPDIESIPRLKTVLSFNSRSNVSLFERLFLFFLLVGKRKSDFVELNTKELGFGKYQGYFYQKSFRTEEKKVSLLYTHYDTAQHLVRLFEGEGIRVVDLSPTNEKKCIIEDTFDRGKPSLTSRYLAYIFSCPIGRKKERGLVKTDIVVVLNEKIEKEWE